MSKATELAKRYDSLAIVSNKHVRDDLLAGAIAEVVRLDRVNAELRKALVEVLRNFPTDDDLMEAGWSAFDIEAACKSYDDARAALKEATES